MSDEEYDKLFSELVRLEENHPEFASKSSPTKVVGSSLTKSDVPTKVFEHSTPMLSLANAFSLEEVENWDARIRRMSELEKPTYTVEIKYDGIAMALHYEDGKFIRALTRGDGKFGEEATAQIRRFAPALARDLPASYAQYGSKIEIRGEVFLTKDAFAKLSAGDGKTFTNARNVTSGILKRKAVRIEAELDVHLDLSFVGYGMIADKTPETHEKVIQTIADLGIPTGVPYFKVLDSISDFEALEQEWSSIRAKLPFEADGLVLKLNERFCYDRLGSTSHSPRWALAWKFSSKQATTTLLSIELSVGRSGKVTPVAIIEPVRLAGVQISRATLHNKDYVDKNHFVPGCRVIVERSGDVIPKIVGRAEDHSTSPSALENRNTAQKSGIGSQTDASKLVDWSVCPCSMKHPLVPQGNSDYACTNLHCPPQQQRRLEHFCAVLDIEGLGPSSLKHLVEGGLVSQFSDIFTLKDHSLAKLAMRDGWGEKKVRNLLSSIETAREKTSLATLLHALGIPHVGKETAESVALKIGSMRRLMACEAETLKRIEDIGPAVSSSIVSYFGLPSTGPLMQSLESSGLRMEDEAYAQAQLTHLNSDGSLSPSGANHTGASSGSTLTEPKKSQLLAGMSFAFTGAMEKLSRKEAELLVKQAGGKAKPSVTKGTTYLVEGKAASSARTSSSKLTQALASGTKVITESEFLDLIKSPNSSDQL